MKRLTLFALFISIALLGGCKKDPEAPSCGEQLTGKWRAYSLEIDNQQFLGFNGQGGFNSFEAEFNNFNQANNNGELRITYQYYGEVPGPPFTGLFSPSTSCDKLDTPAFFQSNGPTIRWDIISLTSTRLILEANPVGYTYRIKFDKI